MLRVLLAEDHNIVRNGIRMLLEVDETIVIAGEAVNGLEVLEFVKSQGAVDLVLTDINMPELDGISLITQLKSMCPETNVVMLSMHDNEKYIAEAFLKGARGYLLKNISSEELIFALKHIHAGSKYMCAELSMRMLENLAKNGHRVLQQGQTNIEFSALEMQLLNLIAEGFTNHEMAHKLQINKRTVEAQRQHLIDKTGVRNTAALIRFVVSTGVIQ
jgi:DNA-binding NarL/FixJ family response regulator